MKKIILLSLFISPVALVAMNNKPEMPEITKEQAIDYANNCWLQKTEAWGFLNDANINPKGLYILDVGCATGNITAMLASEADVVDGFDDRLEMLKRAQESYSELEDKGMVEFKEISLENFWLGDDQYDLVTSFFYVGRIEDKQKVFNEMYKGLKDRGQLIFNLSSLVSKEGPSPLVEIMGKLLKDNNEKYPVLKNYTFPQLAGLYPISEDALKGMLEDCGFKNVVIENKLKMIPFESKDDYYVWQRAVFAIAPVASIIAEAGGDVEAFLTEMVDLLWASFEKTEDGGALYPFVTTVVTACKS